MSATKREIVLLVGDVGGTREMVPVARLLTERGIDVVWFVDHEGEGGRVLKEADISYTEVNEMPDLAYFYGAFVIATSATAYRSQVEWTWKGRIMGTPVIWLADLWGTAERPTVQKVSPRLMLVIDQVAEQIAKKVRPGMATKVVGKPTFEGLSRYTPEVVAETRVAVRGRYAINDNSIALVIWTGGEYDRVRTQLAAFCDITEIAGRKVVVVPRLHPKMPKVNRKLIWDMMCRTGEVIPLDAHKEKPEDLNCAADVVFGDWGSTQCYVTALLGVPVFMMLWPDDLEKRKAVGYPDGAPPLLLSGAGRGLVTYKDVIPSLDNVVVNLEHRSEATYRAAREAFGKLIEPGAAKRAAEAIVQYMENR